MVSVSIPPQLSASNTTACWLPPLPPAPPVQTVASQPIQQTSGAQAAPVSSLQPPTLLQELTSPAGYPLKHYALGNGHQVLIEERPSDVISLRTFIRAGSVDEKAVYPSPLYAPNPFPSGIAHLDEHCHFLTTEHYPDKNQWVNTVEHLGTQLNASTGYEEIQHELMFNREDLPNLLQLHAEAVMHPLYNPQAIVQEKRNVINECSERMAPPEAVIYSKLLEMLFDRPHFQSLGNRGDVLGTTAEQIQQFYQTYYTPTNMVTCISGRVTPEEVLPLLNREFGANPPRNGLENPTGLELALKPHEIRSVTLQDPQLATSEVAVAWPGVSFRNAKDMTAINLLTLLLSNGPLSPLQNELVEKNQSATDVALQGEFYKKTGMVMLDFHTKPGQEREALGQALQVIQQAREKPFTPERVASMKAQLLDFYQRVFQNVHQSTQFYGASLLHHTLDNLLTLPATLDSITPEDIQKAAQTYLDPGRFAVVFAQPGAERATSAKLSTLDGPLPDYQPEGTGIQKSQLT